MQTQKRTVYTAALACALFALAAAGLTAVLCFHARTAKPLILAAGEGWTVRRGAPAQQGQELTIPRSRLLAGTLMLVSPQHPLPPDFPPPDTRSIRATVGNYLPAAEDASLLREAVYALCAMRLEYPLAEGITIQRGALSAAQQEEMRREAFQRFAKLYPLTEAVHRAAQAVPAGGESEHQTGYALDIVLTGPLAVAKADPLLRSETGKWLADNMWRFGFLYRYAPGQEEEGACEGIHLRYVGNAHAAAMRVLNLGLEDYLALLRREGALTLLRGETPYAYLYCTPCAGDWRVSIPSDTAYQVSADNTGWAVAVVSAQGAF